MDSKKKVIRECKDSNEAHYIRLKTFRSIEDLNEFLEEARKNGLKCEINFTKHVTDYESSLKVYS